MRRFLCFTAFSFVAFGVAVATAQTVPVTFHFDPPTADFRFVYLAGTFNGWRNNVLLMQDTDGDGVYTITQRIPLGEQMYKFVLDADWGKAYTDPDNPRVNVNDNNNSMLRVSDPMITYLLPKDGSIDTTAAGLPIRATVAFTDTKPIDPATLTVVIDESTVENAASYYDPVKRELIYAPPIPLSKGSHTVTVSASSAAGSISRSSTFERDPDLIIYFVPAEFAFDAKGSLFSYAGTIHAVALVGDFNQWNQTANVMADADSDGVWITSLSLQEGYWEYKFLVNGSLWLTDPDNPNMNPDDNNNSFLTAAADSVPAIRLREPVEGSIFVSPSAVNFKIELDPGVRGGAVDPSTIVINFDGATIPYSFDDQTSELTGTLSFLAEGIHRLRVGFANEKGLSVERRFSYGMYPTQSGFHAVDATGDEHYKLPAGVVPGSADILGFHVVATPQFDSLLFTIEIADITDHTRLGLLITNPVENAYAEVPGNLELETEDWNGAGIFALLSLPGSAFEDAARENRFQIARSPAAYGESIALNSDAITTDKFVFKVALSYLDSLLGSWTRQRSFLLFSYIVTDAGGSGYEVGSGDGGVDFSQDPDVYDVAFVRSAFWQSRVLHNYIVPGQPGGPRLSRLDGEGRGVVSLKAADISDSLAVYGPVISFLTPGVTYRHSAVTVAGIISDTTVTTATFYFNNQESNVTVSSGFFFRPVTLLEGRNVVRVAATDSRGYRSETNDLVMTLEVDHEPWVEITGSVSGRVVSLSANGVSPDGLNLTFTWTQDPGNPAPLSFSATSGQNISFAVPAAAGEYYVNLTATDPNNRRYAARRFIIADSSSVSLNTLEGHARWIDGFVCYEIFPRSFSEQGGFAGITARINEIAELGVDAIWLMPIFEGPSTHGYEITDYFALEADYGTEEEFRALIAAVHNAGLRVILDLVVNHTSLQHPFMQNVLQYHQYSPWADFYIWEGVPGLSKYDYYFDWSSLPNTDMDNPDLREYFIKVSEHWVRSFDIDGYRCDVAWGVEQRNDLFWQEWRKALKNIKPEMYLLAEASSSDGVYYQKRFDSAYDWNLRGLIIDNINSTATINALDAELRRSYPPQARPFRFVENHDEVRMSFSHDVQRSKLAHTIIMTAPGVPLIYAGGEVGEQTTRGLIDWSDPFNLRSYFKNLVSLRQRFIRNDAQITRLANSISNQVYSYFTQTGDHLVVTVANFRSWSQAVSINLSGLPRAGSGPYYVSDLLHGSTAEVDTSQLATYPLSLQGFDVAVLHFGNQPITAVENQPSAFMPREYELHQNHPNPFNPETRIVFDLPRAGEVTLKIFNIRGQEVQTLWGGFKRAGSHSVLWDGKNNAGQNVAAGVYICQLRSDFGVQTKKMVLVR